MPSHDAAYALLMERLTRSLDRRNLGRVAGGALGVASTLPLLDDTDAKKKKKKKKKKKNKTTTTTPAATTSPPKDQFVFDQELGSLVDDHPELLSSPGSIATDADGNLYALNWMQNRIAKFSANGAYARSFGSLDDRGSGNGQFDYLSAFTVDASGRLYVADEIESNGDYIQRIQVLKANGGYLATLGAMSGDYLQEVDSIAIASNGHIFVAGMNGNWTRGIYEWNAAFTYVGRRITLNSQEAFDALAIDNGNRLYAGFVDFAEYPETVILKVYALSDFTEITAFGNTGAGNGEFEGFYGIAADANGNVYVSDSFNSRVQRLTWNGGFTALAYAGQFAIPGSWEDEFGGPGGVAVGNGFVYVADQSNSCVRKLSPTLVEQGRTGEPGVGQFHGPGAAATDTDGNVYVLDNNFVHKLTRQGGAIKKWGGFGTGANEFKFPAAIALSPANEFYIADYGNDRIQVYNTNGDLQRSVTAAQLSWPRDVDFAADGSFFVTNDDEQEVRIFTSADVYDHSWSVTDNYYPDLAVSSDGRVYVADSGDDEVRIFTSDGTPQGSFIIPAPYGIAVDASGRVFVASWPDDVSHIFVRNSTGAPLFTVGTPGSGPGKISSPGNVHITTSGALLVSDYDNGLMRFVPATAREAHSAEANRQSNAQRRARHDKGKTQRDKRHAGRRHQRTRASGPRDERSRRASIGHS